MKKALVLMMVVMAAMAAVGYVVTEKVKKEVTVIEMRLGRPEPTSLGDRIVNDLESLRH